MTRNEVMREIRERVSEHLQIATDRITVHWDQKDERPVVRIPTRVDNIAADYDWEPLEAICREVMESYEAPDVAELTDTDYAARMRARRNK